MTISNPVILEAICKYSPDLLLQSKSGYENMKTALFYLCLETIRSRICPVAHTGWIPPQDTTTIFSFLVLTRNNDPYVVWGSEVKDTVTKTLSYFLSEGQQ